ncbi:cation diffusion facilitator family transporter [Brevibacillus massiliensis]|jgi:cation diffusion facilitator family transporter|uniref:cation diffusion facilitator family transporter n=1 Tax=Brevibacillus massiliensis TaxID=1118054 RepID=UPI0002D882B9|nr:cation diffusion facilitator family transporter [Brevibacillus massiliensis]
MESYGDYKKGEIGAWISIVTYLVLSAGKLIIGYFYHSEALFADGFNNSTDIIASLAVLVGLRISQKPADHDHPYGHFRAETISSLVASFIMLAVGLQVFYQGVTAFYRPESNTPDSITAWAAACSAVVMYLVYRYNTRLAKKINSGALAAAAKDNLSDALVSVGALLAIVGSQYGMPWLDAVTAILIGLFICKTAWGIFRDATHSLTDGFDSAKLLLLKKTIASTPGVSAIRDIKARQLGNRILVDVVILVEDRLTVRESHLITEEIEERLLNKHQIRYTHIHIEPAVNTSPTSTCS